MTVYKIDCKKCTNKKVDFCGRVYCAPMAEGKKAIYIEPGHQGTRDDPDPLCCDFFTTENKQISLMLFEEAEI